MTNKGLLNLTQTSSKDRWWPNGLILPVILALAIINFGCKKEENDEYYVKYEVNSSTIYFEGKLNVKLINEKNQITNLTINTRSVWETIIGPVKKGFKASLSVSEVGDNYGHLTLYTQISVSKNDSPFALKEIDNSDVPRTSLQITYIIDY